MMYANYNAMQNNSTTSAMTAEAAASACAFLLLGSAILAESIFVLIVPIIMVGVRIFRKK